MVDIEYSTDKYKSLKLSIGAIIKNPEIVRFAPIILKLKKCVNMQAKNCHS